MKRFQESNWLVKLIRYRHYVYIPFKWIWFTYFKPMVSYEHYTNDPYPIKSIGIIGLIKYIIRGERIQCHVWKILIGMAQHDMKWYWTYHEVMAKFGMLDDGDYEDFMDPDDYEYIDIEDDIDETEY